MTEIEVRLRSELKALAEQVEPESIRSLHDPVHRRRFPAVRWLAPAMAMVAVLAVVAGVSLARHDVRQRPAPPGASGTMPAYYATLSERLNGAKLKRVALTIRSSATGHVLASTWLPPAPQGPLWISGAADDRTFVLSEGIGSYLLLKLSPDGRIARLSRLPARFFAYHSHPDIYALAGALSPDGREVAFLMNSCLLGSGGPSICRVGIRVVSLATGASKTWTESVNPEKQTVLFSLEPSWGDSGREMSFEQVVTPSATPVVYRLLNAAGPGGSLLADSRLIFSFPVVADPEAEALLTPDGRALVLQNFANAKPPGKGGRGDAEIRVVERSVLTGRLLGVLHVLKVPQQDFWNYTYCDILSMGPTGVHVLMQCNDFGRLDGSHFTPLPGVPSAQANSKYGSGGTAAW